MQQSETTTTEITTTIVADGRGTIWHNLSVQPDNKSLIVKSKDLGGVNDDKNNNNNNDVRICFRNHTLQKLLLCWIGHDGTYHHYYTLPPYNKRSKVGCNSKKSRKIWYQKVQMIRHRSHPNPRDDVPIMEHENLISSDIKNEDDTILLFEKNDHIETSMLGHAFIIIAPIICSTTTVEENDRIIQLIQQQKSIDAFWSQIRIVGAYTTHPPITKKRENVDDEVDKDDDINEEEIIHLVEVIDPTLQKIEDHQIPTTGSTNHHSQQSSLRNHTSKFVTWYDNIRNHFTCCCPPSKVKDEEREIDDDNENQDIEKAYQLISTPPLVTTTTLPDASGYILTARLVREFIHKKDRCAAAKIIDTSKKYYQRQYLGQCRWPVMVEPKWYGNDRTLEDILAHDLDCMVACLPKHAVILLRDTSPTPIYINQTLKYGKKSRPQNGSGMCFHPGSDWLQQNGMSIDKCECVELYRAREYPNLRQDWGEGGVLLHEFSHAYHHKGCIDGYDNDEIQQCYEHAIMEGIYDSVHVHGPQGPTAEAYAKTNAMEYFAELSTAFLGGIPNKTAEKIDPSNHDQNRKQHVRTSKRTAAAEMKKDNRLRTNHSDSDEYNKWYPHNRQQIRDHDPRAYELLKKIWKIQD